MPKLDLDAIPQTNAMGCPAPSDADSGGCFAIETVFDAEGCGRKHGTCSDARCTP